MFPTGMLSFLTSQKIRSSDIMSISIDTIRHFLEKIGEKYTFKNKPNNQHENPKPSEPTINKVMQGIIINENNPASK